MALLPYLAGAASTAGTYFTSIHTTTLASWSTGGIYAETFPTYYDLRAAKQYLTQVVTARKNKVTTESSGDEGAHVGGFIRFGGADRQPHRANTTGIGSTSTTT